MHRMTFQFGSEFDANQRIDPSFERAMAALSGQAAATLAGPLPGRLKSFTARLGAISGTRHAN